MTNHSVDIEQVKREERKWDKRWERERRKMGFRLTEMHQLWMKMFKWLQECS